MTRNARSIVQRRLRDLPLAFVVLALLAPLDHASARAEGSAGPDTVAVRTDTGRADGPAALLVASLPAGSVRDLVTDVLARNPDLAGARAAAAAAAERPTRASTLPDPMLGVTAFPESPQTRVGPQDLSLSLSQRFPWFGTLGLKGKAASDEARAEAAGVRALRLALVTETRRLAYELAYVDEVLAVVAQDRATLVHYEELARARYASGVGLEQAVIKIQAEISKADARRLDLDTQRAALAARINALRDRPDPTPVTVDSLPRLPEVTLDPQLLRTRALARRPELEAADARIDRSQALIDLAHKRYGPDFQLGLVYTFVGERNDPAGLAAPPPDNGSDILGVSAGISLPLWRGGLKAGVAEASQEKLRAVAGHRSAASRINGELDDLLRRVPLAWDRLHLYRDILGLQAAQALGSAESAYAATTIGALDLLDAERVLLEVRIGTARARADYAIALARLEGAVGGPVATAGPEGEQK